MSAHHLPPTIARATRGYRRTDLRRWRSPSHVVFLDSDQRAPLVLKIAPSLVDEFDRLRWIGRTLPCPEVVAFDTEDGVDYLLITRIPGSDGTDTHEQLGPRRFVDVLATALRTFHDRPIDDCPFQATAAQQLEMAEARLRHGLVAATHLPARYLGLSPEDLMEILQRLRPSPADLVFTHGDASLPNFMFVGEWLSGYVDLGMAGVAEPSRDLALAACSVTRNIGGRWVRPLLEAYGLPADDIRMEFYMLLDEFL